MTEQIELWKGPFGDAYQERNLLTDDEVMVRQPFWENIIKTIYMNSHAIPSSILEVGAGQGPNLAAIHKVYMGIEKPVELFATETNEGAAKSLTLNVPSVVMVPKLNVANLADLTYTYGVLIHTHPAHLRALQREIFNVSKRWIMCVEYFAPVTRMLPYRGQDNALWLDDYGAHWMNNFPLRCIGYGFCWKRTTKLDNVTFWIFEKIAKMN